METNQQYKIRIFDKNYGSYEYINTITNSTISKEEAKLDPAEIKLFSKDTIIKDSKEQIHILESPLRNAEYIAGVLIISDGRTYGRTKNKKRLLYKCIPDNNEYPIFLIPYEIKHGFSKSLQNKYVLFKYCDWEINSKHPHGTLTEVLGHVGCLERYYYYRLYCKDLFIPIREFTHEASVRISEQIDLESMISKYNIYIDSSDYVFTIDPANTVDFDDAFSILKMDENCIRISVHISNVTLLLENFGLWNYVSDRISSIYLPDQSIHMLPTNLSKKLCSLIEGEKRLVFTMELYFNINEDRLYDIKFKNSIITVDSNYVYEDEKLLSNEYYNILCNITNKLDCNVTNSHEVVSFWMIKMNVMCGIQLSEYKVGIYKTLKVGNNKDISSNFSKDCFRTITNWNNVSSNYECFNNDLNHELLGLKNYCQITSPIRRIVDLVNQTLFMNYIGLTEMGLVYSLSESAYNFCEKWKYKISHINEKMKNIRKIQIDCEILDRIEKEPYILNYIYKGVVFDKKHKYQDMYSHMVFIEDLKILLQFNSTKVLENYKMYDFQLFVFECEDNIKRKIRLQIVNI